VKALPTVTDSHLQLASHQSLEDTIHYTLQHVLFQNRLGKKLLELQGKISRKLPVKIRHTSQMGRKERFPEASNKDKDILLQLGGKERFPESFQHR
jgi:hypothetical protein